ncbi:MAG: hypothetical protein KTR29_17710, partial [Rhodothermaceae bacterium]|nr:hypothetical protein [Rhodothermaceae bacterium]
TLGGLALFGVVGFIVGPLIAALFLTIWDIYGFAFKEVLPETYPLGSKIPDDPSPSLSVSSEDPPTHTDPPPTPKDQSDFDIWNPPWSSQPG